MLLSGVMLVLIGTVAGEWTSLHFSTRSFTALAYLVVFGSVAGYTAYLYALKNLPVSTVSLYAYVNPVIAVVLGAIVLNEPFTMRIAMASLLVFAGIAVVKTAGLGARLSRSPAVSDAPSATVTAVPCKERDRGAYATQ